MLMNSSWISDSWHRLLGVPNGLLLLILAKIKDTFLYPLLHSHMNKIVLDYNNTKSWVLAQLTEDQDGFPPNFGVYMASSLMVMSLNILVSLKYDWFHCVSVGWFVCLLTSWWSFGLFIIWSFVCWKQGTTLMHFFKRGKRQMPSLHTLFSFHWYKIYKVKTVIIESSPWLSRDRGSLKSATEEVLGVKEISGLLQWLSDYLHLKNALNCILKFGNLRIRSDSLQT